MNKTICDVCGTVIPETAEQCPICGCAKPEESGAVKTYTHVKGGRFSTKNVKKRNKEKQLNPGYHPPVPEDEEEQEETSGSNRGLVITVIILLLAIFAVVAYLYINYWMPNMDKPGTTVSPVSTTGSSQTGEDTQNTQQTEGTTEATVETTGATISGECTDIVVSQTLITLSNVGDGYLLSYTLEPVETTDTVSYASSDPTVATVDSNGKITAVGPGTATITITCGNVQAECTVTCEIETEPTTEPTTAPTETEVEFVLSDDDNDITLPVGLSWPMYNGTIAKTEITWWVDDESIATVKNGTVTAVSVGWTTLYAKYKDTVLECIVRVIAAES